MENYEKILFLAILAYPLYGSKSIALIQENIHSPSIGSLEHFLDKGNNDFEESRYEKNQETLNRAILSTSQTLLKLYTSPSSCSELSEEGGDISVSALIAENECRLFDLCLAYVKQKSREPWKTIKVEANKQYQEIIDTLQQKALEMKNKRE